MTYARTAHRVLYRLKCYELVGTAFQTFFEQAMTKADSTFVAVKPSGPDGDWKCDGYSAASKTVFQCYAPEHMTAWKTRAKVESDFKGARHHWRDRMKRWVLVWNAPALPPQVVSLLADLSQEYPDVEVGQIGRDRLWDDVLSQLPHDALNELLGSAVGSDVVENILSSARAALRADDVTQTRELCSELLSLTSDNTAPHINQRCAAFNLLAACAIRDRDLAQARQFLNSVQDHPLHELRPSIRANYQRLLGMTLAIEARAEEAKCAYLAGLTLAASDPVESEILRDYQLALKGDLLLLWCGQRTEEPIPPYATEITDYLRDRPDAWDGRLLLHGVYSLVTVAARTNDMTLARATLQLLDAHCVSTKRAYDASETLQEICGTTVSLHSFEIGLLCCECAGVLARRAKREDFYWVAQYHEVVMHLQLGHVAVADQRLQSLLPLLEARDVDDAIKAGILWLASALASAKQDSSAAVDLQGRVLPYAVSQPEDMCIVQFILGQRLRAAGRMDEALGAFLTAERLAADHGVAEATKREILQHLSEAAILVGAWTEAERGIAQLSSLTERDADHNDHASILQSHLNAAKALRERIATIESIQTKRPSLLEANSDVIAPLLRWWREIEKEGCWFGGDRARAGAVDESDMGLRVLYDYWGGGAAAQVLANLRNFAPDHFSPFIEVRSLDDVRRAVRMFALVADTLVLLWKGPMDSRRMWTLVPVDEVLGGAGYVGFFGTILKSKSDIPWVASFGSGAYLPEEVCRFLLNEAASLLAQGRLIILPALAVGCWQDPFGPCEKLLVELTSTVPVLNGLAGRDSSPIGFLPFFDDAPMSAIGDLLGERPEQTRRLRLALTRRARELRQHGSTESATRELRDELTDALAEWSDVHLVLGRKYQWKNDSGELSSSALRFQSHWSPLFMLSHLGYRMRIDSVVALESDMSRHAYMPKAGAPFGNWLLPPGPNILSAVAKRVDDSAPDSATP